ncbi:MAG: dienelactone hydrolase family protein [Gemmatimonadaceae bacterium]
MQQVTSETPTSWVTVKVEDGTEMRVFVARPSGRGPHRAIIVMQEAFGVNSHIRDVTSRFAREGFVAVAPELFHRTGTGVEGRYDDFPGMAPHFKALTNDGIVADAKAAFAWLSSQRDVDMKRVAATGYCLGGRASFLANSALPLAAGVSYYAGGMPGVLDRVGALHGPQTFFWGGRDTHITDDQKRAVVDAFRAAKKTFTNIEFSQADHGFFCDQRSAYEPNAAREAWALTLAFLDDYTGQ